MSKYIFILLISLFFSCNQNVKTEKTKPALNKNTITNLLIDLHITEGHITQLKLNSSETKDSLSFYKQLVFNKHNISEIDFDQSLNYYSNSPAQLLLIYLNVRKELQLLNQKLPHIEEEEMPSSNSEKILKGLRKAKKGSKLIID